MYCSRCGAANGEHQELRYCWSCGASLAKPSSPPQPVLAVSPAPESGTSYAFVYPIRRFRNVQALWKLVLLSVLSFGTYQIHWFYRNWRDLKAHKGLDIHPGWRTLGLVVPIYNLFLVYRQLRDIRDLGREAGAKVYDPGLLLVGYVVLSALWRLPDPYWIIEVASVIPLALAQGGLNAYWRRAQPDLPERRGLTAAQITIVVFGVLAWLLVLIGLFLPEEVPIEYDKLVLLRSYLC